MFVSNRPVRAVMYVTPKVIVNPFMRRNDALKTLGFEFEVLLPVWGRGWPADPVWILALTGALFGNRRGSRTTWAGIIIGDDPGLVQVA